MLFFKVIWCLKNSPPLHSQEARPAPTSVFDDFSFSFCVKSGVHTRRGSVRKCRIIQNDPPPSGHFDFVLVLHPVRRDRKREKVKFGEKYL